MDSWKLWILRKILPQRRQSGTLYPIKVIRSQNEFNKSSQQLFFSLKNKLIKTWDGKPFTVRGICTLCNEWGNFLVDMQFGGQYYEGRYIPNWRERLVCPVCHLNNRQRLIVTLLQQYVKIYKTKATIYLMEQITPLFCWVENNFSEHIVIGSEYLGNSADTIDISNWPQKVHHEDVTNLSFQNNSIDIIISNDVFEHIHDPKLAFNECYRVLKPRGVLLATFPFHWNEEKSVQRAILNHEVIQYIKPPVYHGNPLSEKGSLVFTDFGWNCLDWFKNAGFKDVSFKLYHSSVHCFFPTQAVFTAVKDY